mmetsp:Transcript_10592/g.20940  ORF Transcript_10592/g.20940 Transcript_10592/m.20940 type:complete len:248 (-) Transcript_10592:542-1285(-)
MRGTPRLTAKAPHPNCRTTGSIESGSSPAKKTMSSALSPANCVICRRLRTRPVTWMPSSSSGSCTPVRATRRSTEYSFILGWTVPHFCSWPSSLSPLRKVAISPSSPPTRVPPESEARTSSLLSILGAAAIRASAALASISCTSVLASSRVISAVMTVLNSSKSIILSPFVSASRKRGSMVSGDVSRPRAPSACVSSSLQIPPEESMSMRSKTALTRSFFCSLVIMPSDGPRMVWAGEPRKLRVHAP